MLTEVEVAYPALPPDLDGYRIVLLGDLHVDALPGTTERAIEIVRGVEADLCVLAGDYRAGLTGPFDQVLGPLSDLVAAIRAPDGIYGVLGNHDGADMLDPLEALGIRMLVNESASVERGAARLVLTGTDDPHYFFTTAAVDALEAAPEGFRLAICHSAEIADHAAAAGHDLYLCGHTHAGQISFPGGRPIISHLVRFAEFAAGRWRWGEMQGYTTSGTGVSLLPVRLNTRGEVAVLTLRRAG